MLTLMFAIFQDSFDDAVKAEKRMLEGRQMDTTLPQDLGKTKRIKRKKNAFELSYSGEESGSSSDASSVNPPLAKKSDMPYLKKSLGLYIIA